jgi:hypothetical protein
MGKLLLTLILLLGQIDFSVAGDGNWNNTGSSNWDANDNWQTTDNMYPNGDEARASFVGFPTTSSTITSDSDITLNSLVLNTPADLNIAFGSGKTLNFRNSADSNIFSYNTSMTGNTFTADTPIHFTTLSVSNFGNLTFDCALTGNTLYLNNLTSSTTTLTGSNKVGSIQTNGSTVIGGADNTTVVSGNLIVINTLITHIKNNHYSETSNIYETLGLNDLNGTTQTLNSISLQICGCVEGSFQLLQAAPNPAMFLILSFIKNCTVQLVNGGDIEAASSAFIKATVDLNNNEVNVDVVTRSVLYGPVEGLFIQDSDFINGTLNKMGTSFMLFLNGSVPTFNINEGRVILGDPSPLSQTTATGLVTIQPGGALSGFQTLLAEQGVINEGSVQPGDPFISCDALGTITIQGDYTQKKNGALKLKGLDADHTDKLIVDSGDMILSGELFFDSLNGASFNEGDQFHIIQNTNNSTPIRGRFCCFSYNLPDGLSAHLIYRSHAVSIQITRDFVPPYKPPCKVCSSCKTNLPASHARPSARKLSRFLLGFLMRGGEATIEHSLAEFYSH